MADQSGAEQWNTFDHEAIEKRIAELKKEYSDRRVSHIPESQAYWISAKEFYETFLQYAIQ